MDREINDILIFVSYSGSVREKIEFEFEQLKILSESSSSIPIPDSSRFASLTNFLF